MAGLFQARSHLGSCSWARGSNSSVRIRETFYKATF